MRESFQGTLQSQCSNTILRASLPPLQLLQGILTSLEVAKSNILKFTKKCVFASNSCVLTIFGGIPKWKCLLLRNFRKVIFILQLTQKWLKRNFLEQKHIFFANVARFARKHQNIPNLLWHPVLLLRHRRRYFLESHSYFNFFLWLKFSPAAAALLVKITTAITLLNQGNGHGEGDIANGQVC